MPALLLREGKDLQWEGGGFMQDKGGGRGDTDLPRKGQPSCARRGGQSAPLGAAPHHLAAEVPPTSCRRAAPWPAAGWQEVEAASRSLPLSRTLFTLPTNVLLIPLAGVGGRQRWGWGFPSVGAGPPPHHTDPTQQLVSFIGAGGPCQASLMLTKRSLQGRGGRHKGQGSRRTLAPQGFSSCASVALRLPTSW